MCEDKVLFERQTEKGTLKCTTNHIVLKWYFNGDYLARCEYYELCSIDKMWVGKYGQEAIDEIRALGRWGVANTLTKAATYMAISITADEYAVIERERAAHLEKLRQLAKAETKRNALHKLTVMLSTRGWGDYDSLVWVGYDDELTDAEIVAQCQKLLTESHDVDIPNQTDAEIIAKINKARTKRDTQNQADRARLAEVKGIINEAPPHVIKAHKDCGGDADNLYDDIDNPLYYAVRAYDEALTDYYRLKDQYDE